MFEPFYHQGKGQGTGLGLSTVYGIVNRAVGSSKWRASRAVVLPSKYSSLVWKPPGGAESVAVGGDSVRGRETVLLVEG